MKLNTPFKVKMKRLEKDKIEVMVCSTSFHKSNENLLALAAEGLTLSDTLSRTKGGVSLTTNSQFNVYMVATEAQAKAVDPDVYGELPLQGATEKESAKEAQEQVGAEKEPVQEAEQEKPKTRTRAKPKTEE